MVKRELVEKRGKTFIHKWSDLSLKIRKVGTKFNTVQVGCTFHTANNNTSTADSNYVLLAEYMLPSQTIVAGGSATYRLKIDNA